VSKLLDETVSRISKYSSKKVSRDLEVLKEELFDCSLNGKGVSHWHCVLELICATPLIEDGYDIRMEHPLGKDNLVCDIYGTKNGDTTIVEVETGFTLDNGKTENRNHILDSDDYLKSRVASKIVRYSPHSDTFILATRKIYTIEIPEFFLGKLGKNSIDGIKKLCEPYYNVKKRSIMRSHLDYVFVIDMDKTNVRVTTPKEYSDWENTLERITSHPSLYFRASS